MYLIEFKVIPFEILRVGKGATKGVHDKNKEFPPINVGVGDGGALNLCKQILPPPFSMHSNLYPAP